MIKKLAKQLLGSALIRARPGNVAMFHLGRCGSTVLAQMLNQHPRIYWRGEIYSPILAKWRSNNAGIEKMGEMPEDPIRILRRDMLSSLHRFYGVEMKPFHFRLIRCSMEAMFLHMDALGFTHFILLDRRNRLRKIVSSIIAHENAEYHIKSTDRARPTAVRVNAEKVRIDFDAKPLLDYLSDYDVDMKRLEANLGVRNVLRLTYEDDLQNDPTLAYSRVCDFLGLKPGAAHIGLARTNPFPLRDMIENWNEVEQTLHGTAYEWMLHD